MKNTKRKKTKLAKVDLHAHTNLNDGLNSIAEMLLAAEKKQLDFLAITDHNMIKSGFVARKYASTNKLKVKIIIGEEVESLEGEIIGLFLKKRIPQGLTAVKTCLSIKKQGGLVMLPHPLRRFWGKGLDKKTILNLYNQNLVDLFEHINTWDYPGLIWQREKLLTKINKPVLVANSDSHTTDTLGITYNQVKAKTLSQLKKELKEGRVTLVLPKISLVERLIITLRLVAKRILNKFLGVV